MKNKVVLIGPVYPYKGGIAHYTNLMYRELAKKCDAEMISYKMQYPKLLFKKEQKDYTNEIFKVDNTQFLINTANPFNIIKVARQIRRKKPALVIIQWWHPYFAPCYYILSKVLGNRVKKVYVCHNVFPHERFPLDRFLTRIVLKSGNGFLVHSESDGQDLLQIRPDAKYIKNPIPTYDVFKVKDLTIEQARRELKEPLNTKLILFFGFVREYKGLKHLLRAFPKVKEKLDDVNLMVVGSFGEDKEDYIKIISEYSLEDSIRIVDDYVPDNEIEKYFMACDVVVVPYESATQSGIVQLAYEFEKPVIVTNVGGLPDVVRDGETGYIIPPKNPELLADTIIRFYSTQNKIDYAENIRNNGSCFSWEGLIDRMLDYFL